LNDQKIVIVNKFYPLEGKVNCLLDIIREINMDISKFSEKNKVLYFELSQTQLKL
jgi:FtsZ-binding cell division protein ZapB